MRMKSILALSMFALSTVFSVDSFAAQYGYGNVSAEAADEVAGEVCDDEGSNRWWPSWPSFIPAFSAPCCIDDSNFVLGVEFAYGRLRNVFTTDYTSPGATPPITENQHYDATLVNQGFLMGVLGGWQLRYQRFMFGIEANLDLTAIFNRNRYFNFTDYLYSNDHWYQGMVLYRRGPILGLTGRLGYFVTPGFFPYVRAGVQSSRDTVAYQVFEGSTPPALTMDDWSSHKKTILGAVLGVGAEFPAFIGPSTVRIEYNFTQNQNLVISDNVPPIFGTHNFHEGQSHVLKAAWVWNFD